MKITLITLMIALSINVSAQVYTVTALATFNSKTTNSNYVEVKNVTVILYKGMFMCANHEDDCTYFFTDTEIKLPDNEHVKYTGKTYLHTPATLEIWKEKGQYKCKINTHNGIAYFFLGEKDTLLTEGLYLK